MTFSEFSEEEDVEFCRVCGVTVTWTSESWVHDYPPPDDHLPVVPVDPFGRDLYET